MNRCYTPTCEQPPIIQLRHPGGTVAYSCDDPKHIHYALIFYLCGNATVTVIPTTDTRLAELERQVTGLISNYTGDAKPLGESSKSTWSLQQLNTIVSTLLQDTGALSRRLSALEDAAALMSNYTAESKRHEV